MMLGKLPVPGRPTNLDNTTCSWLVDCFGLDGPLRQHFSLYRAVSQREGERKDRREKKMSKQPHPHLLQAQ